MKDEYDTSDVYRAMKERSKEKRAENRESSPKVLVENGFKFTAYNSGAHLVVYGSKGLKVADFWPGSGRWILRDDRYKCGGERGFGVFNLVKKLKGEK